MSSSRFPGKPLVKILDLPMIEHVRRRACLSDVVDDVYVATCDREIFDAVHDFGGKAIMTAAGHERCTDRIEEAARRLDADLVVNVQGDEPLLLPEVIGDVIRPLLEDSEIPCTNLLSPLAEPGELEDRNVVKAFIDQKGFIMCFLRTVRLESKAEGAYPVYRQTGIIAFQKHFLHTYSRLPETPLERVESVDMSRVLEHGYRILGVVGPEPTLGVDRPEDVDWVERLLREVPEQQRVYERILALGAAR
jgi:3-deoxy-manno-octulosonate cytidylyltransferase (CMP-KDO synthetase)